MTRNEKTTAWVIGVLVVIGLVGWGIFGYNAHEGQVQGASTTTESTPNGTDYISPDDASDY